MSFDELTRMVEGGESQQLVGDLLIDTHRDPKPLLERLNEDFFACVKSRPSEGLLTPLDILCYYETQVTIPMSSEVNFCYSSLQVPS